MKIKLLSVLLLFLMVGNSFGQTNLKVKYEAFSKQNLDNIEAFAPTSISQKEYEQAYKDAMNEVHEYELTIQGQESNFSYIEKINNELPKEGRIRISMKPAGSFNYKNLSDSILLQKYGTMRGEEIVWDKLKNYDWKIERESKEILGYTTRKATAVIDSINTLEAWFAPKIAIKNGPHVYWGLPGLILELTTRSSKKNKRESTFRAIAIHNIKEEVELEVLNKEDAITKEEFKKREEEAMKKIKEMYSKGVDTSD